MIRIEIFNDEAGNEIVGNYRVYLTIPTGRKTVPWRRVAARVENHTRSNGWDALVLLAVKALKEQMK